MHFQKSEAFVFFSVLSFYVNFYIGLKLETRQCNEDQIAIGLFSEGFFVTSTFSNKKTRVLTNF